MKRVLTAAVLVPLVLLVVFRAPLWLFALVVAGVAILALHEYLNILKAHDLKPMRILAYAVGLLAFCWTYIQCVPMLVVVPLPKFVQDGWGVVLMLPIIFGIPLVFRSDLRKGLLDSAGSCFGVLYIPFSLMLLLPLRSGFSPWLVVFVLFSVWAGDTAAYYVGRTLGRHKLAPAVSPNKTWEGSAGSIIASVAVAFLIFHYQLEVTNLFRGFHGTELEYFPSRGQMIVLGIVTNIAAQFGDLFESAIKRSAQIKDSGSLLPGHGGVLDRIDALLFAIPVVWYYAISSNSFYES